MAFEVAQADDDIGVHDGVANLGVFDQLAVVDRHFHVVSASQAVADDDGTAAGDVVEPVLRRCQQVLQGVLPATRIEGVAVGEERLAAQLLHHIHHRSGVVGTQESQVARLAKVHFDGDEFSLKVDGIHACLADELLELFGQALFMVGSKVCKINFGCHLSTSRFLFSIFPQSLPTLREPFYSTCSGRVDRPCAKVFLRKTLVTPDSRRVFPTKSPDFAGALFIPLARGE